MPDNIRRARNIAIVLGFIEFVCCLASLPLFLRRRSRVILFFVILTFIVSIFGMWAKIRLNYWGLATHAFFTIGFVGGFYIYLIIEMCVGTEHV